MILVLIAVAFLAFLAGFFVSCLFLAGAEEDRRREFASWCEARCGKRVDAEYEWRDGDD